MRILPIVVRVGCMAFVCAAVLCHGQVQPSWVHRYTGRGGSQHLTAGPALASSAVYLAGRSEDDLGGDAQIVVVGYGLQTTEFFEGRHNLSTNQNDEPTALQVLPDGNLLMAGVSGPFLNTTLLTAKLRPDGAEIWSRRFDGANFDPDEPVVATFDSAGNIYVAGTTLASSSDIVTLKYSPEGQQQWTSTFAGLSGGADDVAAIQVDAVGNVYLTGRSRMGGDLDLYTLKYDTDGNELWVKGYGGPLRQQENAGALVLDASGNVYVSGASMGQTGSGFNRFELAVIKYDPVGNELWTVRYGLPGDINEVRRGMAIDAEENLLILANIQNGGDNAWLLLKFDRDGNRLWTARYNGVEDGYDNSYALAVDGAGDAYVVAASDDPSAWQFVTAKYDRFGNRRWLAKFDADGIFDFPVGVAVDPGGGVYVAGQSREFTGPSGFLTIRYAQPSTVPAAWPSIVTPPRSEMVAGGSNVTFNVTASGQPPLAYQWRYNGRRIPDATNSILTLTGVVLEQSGHYSVEVTNAEGSVGSPEADLLVLIPPSITAQPQHQFVYAGTEATFDVGAYGTEPFQFQWLRDGIALSNGLSRLLDLRNVHVSDAGEYQAVVSNISGSATSAVARLTVSRLVEQDWAALYDGPGHDTESSPIVKVDDAGNVYVAGTSRGTRKADFAVLKYDPAGTRLWTARYSATPETTEALFAMEIDPDGTVWVTGTTGVEETWRDALTVSFSPDGALRWARQFGVSNSFTAGFAIAPDAGGNCYVAGQRGEDFLTLKYDAAGNELWSAVFNGTANGVDTARALAVSGTNLYVTGSSWNGSNLDFLTVKYSADGGVLWRAIYDATETDNAVAVALDPSGNVVVTGNSYGTINYDKYGSDYLVVKYSPAGARLWTARYDGFMNAEDYPSALASDDVGNIYVTGHSDFESPDSGTRQYATLKYAPDGRELWRSWHVGPQNDGSRSLAVDASGSVYITSLAVSPFGGRDIAFIKYDALGTRILTARYSGAANADDLPSTLALGPNAEVYSAGVTSGASEGGADFALIKYGQNEVAGLPRITEPPRRVDVAQGSDVLFQVTAEGEVPLSYQWFFNDNPIEGATARTFAIPSAQFANGGSYSVRVGNTHGSVLSASAVLLVQAPPSILVPLLSQMVADGSTASITVSAGGSPPFWYQWFFNGVAISGATNQQFVLSNVHSANAGDYSVIVSNRVGSAHSTAGRLRVTLTAQQRWAGNFPAVESGGEPLAMAVGPDGSVHVASGVGLGDTTDYGVVKFDGEGARLWTARYNGPHDGYDAATDIAVDHHGNVYVTGHSWSTNSLFDAATVKFDANGNTIWAVRFNGPSGMDDYGRAIGVDTNGNVIVTLSSVSAPNNVDYVTVCYDALGTQKWVAIYDGPAHDFDQPVDLVVGPAGDVYVTGISALGGFDTDFATVKYDTNGVELWNRRYNGPAGFEDLAVRLRTDAVGNVYVGGWSHDSNRLSDYVIVKYFASGQQAWVARHNGLAGRYDYLSDLLVDAAGNVYATGSSQSVAGDTDWVTLKLNANGQRVWLATYGGRFGVGDNLPLLAFDAFGNICLSGALYTGESYGVATACYDTNGNRRWTAIYGAEGLANEFVDAIASDGFGGVFAGGVSISNEISRSFLVTYAQSNVIGAPMIAAPPASNRVMAGASTTFTVSAQGDGPLDYRWLRGHVPLAQGVSTTNLVLNNAADALIGYYSVEVQNDLGTVVSPAAELRVNGPTSPRLTVSVAGEMLRVVLLGESDFNYRIEASSDLRTWEVLTTTYNQYSSIVITEPLSAAPRYYRAVKLP